MQSFEIQLLDCIKYNLKLKNNYIFKCIRNYFNVVGTKKWKITIYNIGHCKTIKFLYIQSINYLEIISRNFCIKFL